MTRHRVNIRGLEAKPLSGVAGIRQPATYQLSFSLKAGSEKQRWAPENTPIHSMSLIANCFIRLSTRLQTSDDSSWNCHITLNHAGNFNFNKNHRSIEEEHHHSPSTFIRSDPFCRIFRSRIHFSLSPFLLYHTTYIFWITRLTRFKYQNAESAQLILSILVQQRFERYGNPWHRVTDLLC